ncbi:McrB family protein [Bacteroidota bacterium]
MAQVPMHIVLKYSDSYYNVDTVTEHKKMIDELTKVIWGVIRHDIKSPAMGEKRVAQLNNQIKKQIPTYAFISSGSRIKYRGKIENIYTRDELKEHVNFIPNYYKHELDKCANGILLSSLEIENHDIIKKMKMYDSGDSKIALQNQTNPLYVSYENGEPISKLPEQPKNEKNIKGIKTPKEMLNYIHQYMESNGFQYLYEEIANFYLALRAKPFVILAGISGTGKTMLPRKFASAVGMSKEQIIQVPVRPDWTDGSDLLGYVGLDNKFKPKDLTLAIMKAHDNPEKPYFFILDEMNLARVEHYFSDFLSVIETREKKDGIIKTDPILREEVFQNATNSSDYKAFGWPQNLYLIGTVNMDETTHSFSRKVLDRANSIEMNEVNLGWVNKAETEINPIEAVDNSFFQTPFLDQLDLSDANKELIKEEMDLLIQVNQILENADLHFAYRVRNEVAFYLILNKEYYLMDSTPAMDFQLVQKILPRIHGSSERVQKVLVDLLNLLEGKDFKSNGFEYAQTEGKIDFETLKYKRASKKILFMLKRFDDDRFTSFWL